MAAIKIVRPYAQQSSSATNHTPLARRLWCFTMLTALGDICPLCFFAGVWFVHTPHLSTSCFSARAAPTVRVVTLATISFSSRVQCLSINA